jgi:hypothetical protein
MLSEIVSDQVSEGEDSKEGCPTLHVIRALEDLVQLIVITCSYDNYIKNPPKQNQPRTNTEE